MTGRVNARLHVSEGARAGSGQISSRARTLLLLVPGTAVIILLLAVPLAILVHESVLEFIPGSIGAAADAPLTFVHYTDLLHPAYTRFVLDTFRIGFIATIVSLLFAFPVAYFVARTKASWIRKAWISLLISMMFLGTLVRVYAIALAFGPVGLIGYFGAPFGLNPNGAVVTEAFVIAGLFHYIMPMSALILIGTIQNIDPRLVDAGQALGATRTMAHLSITVPLSLPGLVSAFLIGFTLAISAFVIPLVLGKGRVTFISNMIYNRFGELANYPSGAAISVVVLLLTLSLIYLVFRVSPRTV